MAVEEAPAGGFEVPAAGDELFVLVPAALPVLLAGACGEELAGKVGGDVGVVEAEDDVGDVGGGEVVEVEGVDGGGVSEVLVCVSEGDEEGVSVGPESDELDGSVEVVVWVGPSDSELEEGRLQKKTETNAENHANKKTFNIVECNKMKSKCPTAPCS